MLDENFSVFACGSLEASQSSAFLLKSDLVSALIASARVTLCMTFDCSIEVAVLKKYSRQFVPV